MNSNKELQTKADRASFEPEPDLKVANPVTQAILRDGATRRQVMRYFGASATALAAAGSVVSKTEGALAATPQKGGHVRVGVRGGSNADSTDPATFSDVFMRNVAYGYCNTLIEIDGNGNLAPELSEGWEAKPGAAEWAIKIRSGVEFHNGKTMDADDVIASIEHHRGEDTKSGIKATLNAISEIRKDGPDVIVFKLDQGNADFPYIFADYRLMIMPAEEGKIDWQAAVGTGGYTLESLEPGVIAKLKRNPNYWRSDRAFFDSAEVLSMPDVASRQTALISGDIDILDQVDIKSLSLFKKQEGVQVADTNGALHYTYPMNTQTAPFDNNDLRLALKYGIDREALLQKVLRGYGTLGNDHPIAPIHQYHASDVEQHTYDPDKAKYHLNKAGHDRLSLSLSASDYLYPGCVDGAVLYRENLAPIGIDLEVVREPGDGYWSDVWMKKPWVAAYWGARPTEDLILSTAYMSGAPWNDSYLENENLNGLIVQARAELDKARRAAMYREIQVLLRDHGGTVIPVFANNVFAMSDKIGHPEQMSGAWELDGARCLERWWFA